MFEMHIVRTNPTENTSKLTPDKCKELRENLEPYWEAGSTLTEIHTRHPIEVGWHLGRFGLTVNEEGSVETGQYQPMVSIYPLVTDLSKLGKVGLARIMRLISAIVDPASEPEQILTNSPAFVANILALEGVRLKE